MTAKKTQFIKTFKEIRNKDVAIAGGKGASLGEMTNAGVPVPPGFVILAPAFEYFMKNTPKSPSARTGSDIEGQISQVNYDDVNSIDQASNVIRDIMDDTEIPEDLKKEIDAGYKKLGAEFVAVRSSATAEDSSIASWAGELETYLNTISKTLYTNIKKCWSSLFTPRALFYRFEKKLVDQKVSVAVVVQKMVQSEISGICFTVHPIIKDKNQMVIEAGYGLGEAIVSGQITPDTYVIDKRDFSLVDINIAEQERMLVKAKNGGIEWQKVPESKKEVQTLTGQEIIELAKMCVKLEKHYKKPQDIEWAMEKGKIYITQSRPITTL